MSCNYANRKGYIHIKQIRLRKKSNTKNGDVKRIVYSFKRWTNIVIKKVSLCRLQFIIKNVSYTCSSKESGLRLEEKKEQKNGDVKRIAYYFLRGGKMLILKVVVPRCLGIMLMGNIIVNGRKRWGISTSSHSQGSRAGRVLDHIF